MKFIVKDMGISTGGVLIVVMLADDAKSMDFHQGDRILLRSNHRKTVVILDIADNGLKRGQLGLFQEVLDKLHVKRGANVSVDYAHKPDSLHFIKKKLQGKRLTERELHSIVDDIVRDELTEGELTYFVSGCVAHGMNAAETVGLTRAIVSHGERLHPRNKIVVDKHCIGGIPNNRTTLIVVPILAAAGYCMPKTSSRSITSAAGTADTMEVLAPVTFSVTKMKRILRRCKAFIIWGGGMNLASADDKLIKVRSPLSIDPPWMLLASILAKKKAVGATHALIDIPIGKDTKITSRSEALELKKGFVRIARRLGIKIRVIITKGDDIIGNGVGPALEARDVLQVLQQHPERPLDLEAKAVYMAEELLSLVGGSKRLARELLENGLAYKKMKQIIAAQGGNATIKPEDLKISKCSFTFKAHKAGKITRVHCRDMNRLAKLAGSPLDQGAGLYTYRHKGDHVKKGDALFTLYSPSKAKLAFAIKAFTREMMKIG